MTTPGTSQKSSTASCGTGLLAAGIIAVAAVAAYHNSLSGPLIFDDVPTIAENPTIRHLWPIWHALSPPHDRGLTVTGRPIVNLSLALNYAFGGTGVRGYHLVNLVIHLFAGLTLFGIVRRTLRLCSGQTPNRTQAIADVGRGRRTPPQSTGMAAFGDAALQSDAASLAFAIAVIWTVHPLQTEAVTYIVQRSESLMGLFYLLTLYCFIRGAESYALGDTPCLPRSGTEGMCHALGDTEPRGPGWIWYGLSVVACLLGMATKEVMATAPLVVLVYDRTFVAGSLREAWRRRRGYYAGLAVTWLLLGYLMLGSGHRGGTAGFGLGVAPWTYALAQCRAVVHYLGLAFWPHPLVFDYGGSDVVRRVAEVLPQAGLLLLLLAGTIIGLRRQPALGFCGVWFFAILAPTSSFVPVADTVFEHRMYLPLAAVVTLAVVGLHGLLGRRTGIVFLALAVGLGGLTARRNADYRSEEAIWSDTVGKRPNNARAQYTLGSVLFQQGRREEATSRYREALRLKPDSAEAHINLGNALVQMGRSDEALAHYAEALRFKPASADAHNNLGNALVRLGRMPEAITHYETALRLQPALADAQNNLGNALVRLGRVPEALAHYAAALQSRPDFADAHANLGNALAQSGRLSEALTHYAAALQIRPDSAEVHYNLATALALAGRVPEAIQHYEETLRLDPGYTPARENLARVRALQRRDQSGPD